MNDRERRATSPVAHRLPSPHFVLAPETSPRRSVHGTGRGSTSDTRASTEATSTHTAGRTRDRERAWGARAGGWTTSGAAHARSWTLPPSRSPRATLVAPIGVPRWAPGRFLWRGSAGVIGTMATLQEGQKQGQRRSLLFFATFHNGTQIGHLDRCRDRICPISGRAPSRRLVRRRPTAGGDRARRPLRPSRSDRGARARRASV